ALSGASPASPRVAEQNDSSASMLCGCGARKAPERAAMSWLAGDVASAEAMRARSRGGESAARGGRGSWRSGADSASGRVKASSSRGLELGGGTGERTAKLGTEARLEEASTLEGGP